MKKTNPTTREHRLAASYRLARSAVGKLRRFSASRTGLLLQVVVSALLLVWLAKALDARTWTAIRDIGIQGLMLMTLIFSTSQIFSGLRLACLLHKPRPWRLAVASTFAGFFWSTFLPGTVGGDVVRVAKLHSANVEIARATGAIVFDRLLNTLGVATILAVSSAGLITVWALENTRLFLVLLLSAMAAAGLAALGIRMVIRRRLPESLASFLAPIRQLPSDRALLLAVALLTLCNIGSSILALWLLSNLLDMGVSFLTLTSIICLVTIATMLPISLNGIGLQEVSFVYLLTTAGAAPEKAIVFSLLVRAIIMGTSLIAGLAMILNRAFASPQDGNPPPADIR
ncbi:flippase-like domain-containing protein [Bosea sp. LjRoot90]|uniref:lysylphosphatidylglycerol synthase transmembrane domain-containing protein n=1 Tax=Bosea sp. LjRoot90 TaxID=3342342 RepID=UPI003ED0EE08